jgi:hypothetical protein
MSHFIVVVRVPAAKAATIDEVYGALEAMLAPYQENNMGDCPKRYLKFHDVESEEREEYEKADEKTRRRYPTFKQYLVGYCGYRRDPEKGRFGYWENPNKKWDWWVVGGQWRGYFPIKPNVAAPVGEPGAFGNQAKPATADIVHLRDIDMARVRSQQVERMQEFWTKWQDFLAGKEFSPFDSPRPRAIDVGLLEVREGPVAPDEENRCIPWSGNRKPGDFGCHWNDVYHIVSKAELERDSAAHFNPIKPYALLDENGWHEPGEMGWWGCSSATPEKRKEMAEALDSWLAATQEGDWLVAVDCHI